MCADNFETRAVQIEWSIFTQMVYYSVTENSKGYIAAFNTRFQFNIE